MIEYFADLIFEDSADVILEPSANYAMFCCRRTQPVLRTITVISCYWLAWQIPWRTPGAGTHRTGGGGRDRRRRTTEEKSLNILVIILLIHQKGAPQIQCEIFSILYEWLVGQKYQPRGTRGTCSTPALPPRSSLTPKKKNNISPSYHLLWYGSCDKFLPKESLDLRNIICSYNGWDICVVPRENERTLKYATQHFWIF